VLAPLLAVLLALALAIEGTLRVAPRDDVSFADIEARVDLLPVWK
jgi:hypothetical protein